ncbi:rifin [Plasmodium falciparum RAJ116]|uniref:Rifin n=1 Tax=Plasmodium falciparum RAJ116 TaxID=580058 RepID=A0A0L0CS43_PLAFA|nr:rifin [Plasmodium falciparum RAJ116]
MKVHYMNILLFALPLNILIYNQRNHKSTTHHTLKIPITRLLCECELYEPANYDNDQEMKETQQRFEEYDERMQTTRQKCKEQCDKEIQKIILKDKLEKQMVEQFSTLQTDIQNDAFPTCVCEKSIADKVEKGCLECGGILGAAMPELGSIGGSLLNALNTWQTGALLAAEKAAIAKATDLATNAGMDAVLSKIEVLISTWGKDALDLSPIVNKLNFKCPTALIERAKELFGDACIIDAQQKRMSSFCTTNIYYGGEDTFTHIAQAGSDAYDATLTIKTAEFEATKVGAVEATYGGCQTAIIASIVAIVVIILIMVIIYLILRYRRKKKMKKKLQYIKLLKE